MVPTLAIWSFVVISVASALMASTTASVASDDYALLNRLSITVKVRFTNVLDEAMSFNKSFTAYADYDSTKLLTEVAGELVPEIVDQLVNDIFQAAASNW